MKFRYCTECASPLTQRDATEYVCGNGHEYWNEPHGSVCVAVLRDGQVLLARRESSREGQFVLPGRFVDFDETPYEAARREMAEETGLRCPSSTCWRCTRSATGRTRPRYIVFPHAAGKASRTGATSPPRWSGGLSSSWRATSTPGPSPASGQAAAAQVSDGACSETRSNVRILPGTGEAHVNGLPAALGVRGGQP